MKSFKKILMVIVFIITVALIWRYFSEEPESVGQTDNTEKIKRESDLSNALVLDLDKNGIATTGLAGNHYFDYGSDGLREKTAWVGKGDGLLVRDINNDGKINNGAELFGNHTILASGERAKNGFEALTEFDLNKDGVINAQDAIFKELKIFADGNSNGYVEQGELKNLNQLGIVAININFTQSNYVDANGNEHRQIGEFAFRNGSKSMIASVGFKVNLASRREDSNVELSPDILFRPNAKGFGLVHDLHQAMALNSKLMGKLDAVVNERDVAKRSLLLDELIFYWAGADKIEPASRGEYIDARVLVAIEQLTGSGYWGTAHPDKSMDRANPHAQAAPVLMEEYNKFKWYTEAQILAQKYHMHHIVGSGFDSLSNGVMVNWDNLAQSLFAYVEQDKVDVLTDLWGIMDGMHLYASKRYKSEYEQNKAAFLESVMQKTPPTWTAKQKRLLLESLPKNSNKNQLSN